MVCNEGGRAGYYTDAELHEIYQKFRDKHIASPQEMLEQSGNLESYIRSLELAEKGFNEEWLGFLRERVVVEDSNIRVKRK